MGNMENVHTWRACSQVKLSVSKTLPSRFRQVEAAVVFAVG
jgi:hypothetical protein